MIRSHPIRTEDADFGEHDIAWVHPAKREDVDLVLTSGLNTNDGRSDWLWLRLYDGTLVLGMFPQGDTYERVSDAVPFGPRG